MSCKECTSFDEQLQGNENIYYIPICDDTKMIMLIKKWEKPFLEKSIQLFYKFSVKSANWQKNYKRVY